MNINDKVWIRLTEAGVKLWKGKWENEYVHEDGRWFGIQLHSLMTLLGGHLVFAGPQYIVDNEIATEKPKELGGFTPPKAPVVNPALPPDGRLTRTEIFLRLVDSFCRRPKGLEVTHPIGSNNLDELAREAERVFNTWGGK